MGIIDLGASGPSLARALAEPTDVHFIGAVYSPDYAPTRVKLSEAFDALVFIRDTTASVPLAP
jgi:erythromycin esterase-like protein